MSEANAGLRQANAVIDWLTEQRPELGHTYRVAKELLAEAPLPGRERIRVLLVCHAMREVINRLPSAVMLGSGSLSRTAVAKHRGPSKLMRELPKLRPEFPEMDLTAEAEYIPVPREVARVFNNLIDAAMYEEHRRLSDLGAFLTDDANSRHPAVQEWRNLSQFFTRWAHLSDGPNESIPTDRQLTERISVFEEHIDAMRLAFFENKGVVEDILGVANSTVEAAPTMSCYTVPTKDAVDAAVRRLTSYQLRRVFYEGLKNPNWVKPLAALGVFANPPEPETLGDGSIRDMFWPEIRYLINVCTDAPSDVVDILRGLEQTSNSWVRRAAFIVGSQVSVSEAFRLKPLLKAWAASGGFGWRTDPQDLVAFAINLLKGNKKHTKYGVSFANLLFRPREAPGSGRAPVTELEPFWYAEEIPRLAEALGDAALKTILPWLVEHERIKETFTEDFDHSGFTRASVAQQQDDWDDIGDTLIDAVRAAAISGFTDDPAAAWSLFQHNSILITERIAMYSLAVVLGSASDLDVPPLVGIGAELIALPKCRDEGARLEFVALARALAERSEGGMLQCVIEEGHFTGEDRDRIRTNMAAQGETTEEIETSIARWDEHWRHQVLTGIGRELLSPALVSKLEDLDTKYGVLEDPLRPPFQVTSWVGPNSPVEQDEMAAMSPSELMAQLESWHVIGDRVGPGPSHEGQARTLTAVLTVNPHALGEAAGLVDRLRPTYIRAAVGGWKAAYKTGLNLNWPVVIGTLSDVVKHGRKSSYPAEGGQFDDDVDFTSAKQAAVGLLEELSKPKITETITPEWMVLVAELVIEASSDEAAWEDYVRSHESSPGMDPLTASLNWQWPMTVRALINLIAHGPEAQWYEAVVSILDRELARDDPRGASRAVLGEGLGRLHRRAPGWLRENLTTYFGSADSLTRDQQIALTTAIAMHYYHSDLYELLSGSMISTLRVEDEVTVGWGDRETPKARIGQWVVEAIIRGHVSDDDELRKEFYEIGAPEVRGDAIGRIAWRFMHAKVVDEAIRDRLGDLWDERVGHVELHPNHSAELKDFCWFVRCGKFSADWWLPRLRRAVELNPELNVRGMIGEQLAEAASVRPSDALAVLVGLLKSEETSDHYAAGLMRVALAPVIAAAMDSGDQQLAREATDLMNAMGARGETDLDRRVVELRLGSES